MAQKVWLCLIMSMDCHRLNHFKDVALSGNTVPTKWCLSSFSSQKQQFDGRNYIFKQTQSSWWLLGWLFSIYGKIKDVPVPPPTSNSSHLHIAFRGSLSYSALSQVDPPPGRCGSCQPEGATFVRSISIVQGWRCSPSQLGVRMFIQLISLRDKWQENPIEIMGKSWNIYGFL